MFKHIDIKNYQSHKHTRLELHPNVNVIVGRSTSGKSAIFRALNWLITNRPLGDRFRSDFRKKDEPTIVSAAVDTGEEAVIAKNKVLTYSIITKDHTADFGAVGSDIPDLVKSLLRMGELNVQNQLDPHFLITGSAREVARVMNRITKIEEVDEWTKKLTTAINTSNKEVSIYQDQLDGFKTKLIGYADLENFEKAVIEVERLEVAESSLASAHNRIEESINLYLVSQQNLEEIKEWLSIEDHMKGLEKDYHSLASLDAEEVLLKQLLDLEDQISEDKEFLKDIEPLVLSLEEMWGKCAELTAEYASIDSMVNSCNSYQSIIKDRSQIIGGLKQQAVVELQKLGKCPICAADLSEDRIETIVKEWL